MRISNLISLARETGWGETSVFHWFTIWNPESFKTGDGQTKVGQLVQCVSVEEMFVLDFGQQVGTFRQFYPPPPFYFGGFKRSRGDGACRNAEPSRTPCPPHLERLSECTREVDKACFLGD